jgi:DNA-binding response OmpR family regulator
MSRKRSNNRRRDQSNVEVSARVPQTPREVFPSLRGKPRDSVVLVVERDPLVRWALNEGLAGAGYRVLTARDGLHAEALLREIDQDLSLALVDDESWPLTLSARAALQHRWPTLPIIVMLESRDPALEQRVREHGAAEVVTKPLEMADVVRVTDRLTHNVQLPSEASTAGEALAT